MLNYICRIWQPSYPFRQILIAAFMLHKTGDWWLLPRESKDLCEVTASSRGAAHIARLLGHGVLSVAEWLPTASPLTLKVAHSIETSVTTHPKTQSPILYTERYTTGRAKMASEQLHIRHNKLRHITSKLNCPVKLYFAQKFFFFANECGKIMTLYNQIYC
jgi:hypothetical protein